MILAALGGAVGATIRYLVAQAMPPNRPWGTHIVNVFGALALGLVAQEGLVGPGDVFTAGLTGGLTTFSTWMLECVTDDGRVHYRRVVGMLGSGILAAALGLAL